MKLFVIATILFFTFPLIGRAQVDQTSTPPSTNTIELSEYDEEGEIIDDSEGLIAEEEDGEVLNDDEYEGDENYADAKSRFKNAQSVEPPATTQTPAELSRAEKEKLAAERIKAEVLSTSKKAKEKEAQKTKYTKPKHDWKFKDPSTRKEKTDEL